jgi:hypothetical protein
MTRQYRSDAAACHGEPRTGESDTPTRDEGVDVPRALYPPRGGIETLWSIDVRRWDADPDYRAACESFVESKIWGASLRTARVSQDEAGQLVLFAMSWLDSDGGLRRDPVTGEPVKAGVVVSLPEDVELPW